MEQYRNLKNPEIIFPIAANLSCGLVSFVVFIAMLFLNPTKSFVPAISFIFSLVSGLLSLFFLFGKIKREDKLFHLVGFIYSGVVGALSFISFITFMVITIVNVEHVSSAAIFSEFGLIFLSSFVVFLIAIASLLMFILRKAIKKTRFGIIGTELITLATMFIGTGILVYVIYLTRIYDGTGYTVLSVITTVFAYFFAFSISSFGYTLLCFYRRKLTKIDFLEHYLFRGLIMYGVFGLFANYYFAVTSRNQFNYFNSSRKLCFLFVIMSLVIITILYITSYFTDLKYLKLALALLVPLRLHVLYFLGNNATVPFKASVITVEVMAFIMFAVYFGIFIAQNAMLKKLYLEQHHSS